MFENIRLSFRGILSHKLRSFLTMLGIIIGIASIIAIVSTIKGTNDQIEKNLIGSGDNNVVIQIYQGDWSWDMSSGIPSGFVPVGEDVKELLKSIDHVESVSLYLERQEYDAVYHLNTSVSGSYVTGVDTDYFTTAGLVIKNGRGIAEHDRESFSRVAVLDEAAAEQLFSGEDPVGRTIEIRQVPYTVIGVAAEKDEFEPVIETIDDYYMYHSDSTCRIYIPDTTWPVIYQYDEPQCAVLSADDTENMTQIGSEAADIMNSAMYSDDSDYQYKAEDLLQQAKEIQQLSQSTNTMLIWIAGISLLVGGIGVMNIMLVSVTERTSEIGLKKAIGARKSAILGQFLTEAVVLTSTGGILGVLTGILLAELISRLNGTPVAISMQAAVFSVLFSMAIGIVFGLLPSIKAADLDPIEALRRE